MYCLSCGDCCKRMSPISPGKPCPHIAEKGDIILCKCYETRPNECANHDFPARVCPIGMSVLGLDQLEDLQRRLHNTYLAQKELVYEEEEE